MLPFFAEKNISPTYRGRFPLWHSCFQTGWNQHLENTGLLHSFIFGPTRFNKHLKDRPWTCSELGSDAKSNVFAGLFWRPNRHVASFLFHRSRGVHCAYSVWDLENVRLWFEMQKLRGLAILKGKSEAKYCTRCFYLLHAYNDLLLILCQGESWKFSWDNDIFWRSDSLTTQRCCFFPPE